MRFVTIVYQGVRTLLVLTAGVAVLLYLVRTRPQPQSEMRENPGPLVEVLPARLVSEKFTVHAQGTVSPRRAASVVAEIGGRIIERSPRLEEGARFEQGELLLRIDPEDARLKVQQLEGQVEQIRAEMAQLEAERRNIEALRAIASRETELARREYERAQALLKKGTMAQEEADKREKAWLQARTVSQNQENALRLWPERHRVLKARLAVTEASLQEARRDLDRTAVRAPFGGRIEKVDVEVGEFVQPGTLLARIWDDSAVEVRVHLRPEEVGWIVPEGESGQVRRWLTGQLELEGEVPDWVPRARVSYTVGARRYTWPGFVRGFEGLVEQQTRTVPVLIEVRDPWKGFEPGEQPLLVPGMFSRVAIEGREMKGIFALPRGVLQLDGTVWVAEEGKLTRRRVEVLRADGQQVFVTGGVADLAGRGLAPLREGDLVVVTLLAAPVEGMPVRIEGTAEDGGETTTGSLESLPELPG